MKEFILVFCVYAFFSTAPVYAQTSEKLIIVLPAENTVVHRGDTIKIVVDPGEDVSMKGVAILSPLFEEPHLKQKSFFTFLMKHPFTFNLKIPDDARAGTYPIAAMGRTEDDQLLQTEVSIKVKVEMTESFTSIEAAPKKALLTYKGNTRDIEVYGTFGKDDHATLDDLQYLCETSDSAIVAVLPGDGCHVAATGNGVATIRVAAGHVTDTVTINVEMSIRGNYTHDGVIDMEDVNRMMLFIQLHQTPSPTGDDRDLNSDGKIDEQDLAILKTLCTYPQCNRQ